MLPICIFQNNVASKSCRQIPVFFLFLLFLHNQLIIYTVNQTFAHSNIFNPFPQTETLSGTIWHPWALLPLKGEILTHFQFKFLYGQRKRVTSDNTLLSKTSDLPRCSQSCFCSHIFTNYRASFIPESWASQAVFDSLRWSGTNQSLTVQIHWLTAS